MRGRRCLLVAACAGLAAGPAARAGVDHLGCLVVSEVFYDAASADDELEWVELWNGTAEPIDLAEWSLAWGGSDWTGARLQLEGVVEPGAYFVVGGPRSAPENADASFDLAVDLEPDLQNGGVVADGVALFHRAAEAIEPDSLPDFTVLYGEVNESELLGADGLPAPVDVADAPAGASVELDRDGWAVNPAPSPGTGPLLAPEPSRAAELGAAGLALGVLGARRRRRAARPASAASARGAPASGSGRSARAAASSTRPCP
jgi:hypothetical protein